MENQRIKDYFVRRDLVDEQKVVELDIKKSRDQIVSNESKTSDHKKEGISVIQQSICSEDSDYFIG